MGRHPRRPISLPPLRQTWRPPLPRHAPRLLPYQAPHRTCLPKTLRGRVRRVRRDAYRHWRHRTGVPSHAEARSPPPFVSGHPQAQPAPESQQWHVGSSSEPSGQHPPPGPAPQRPDRLRRHQSPPSARSRPHLPRPAYHVLPGVPRLPPPVHAVARPSGRGGCLRRHDVPTARPTA